MATQKKGGNQKKGNVSTQKKTEKQANKMTVQEEKSLSPESLYIPVASIAVSQQVRSNVNVGTDSFKALVQSIKDRGILEPLLVTGPDGGPYTLLCGEKRLVAAQQLGLEFAPVRVMDAVTQQDEIIAFQLTENLQREDLNPIDQAKGMLAYIQAKLPEKGYNVDGVITELMNYNLKPDSVLKEATETFSVIAQIAGKSTRTLINVISLLRLPAEMQTAVSDATLPVSQGYLFATNLDCPDRDKVFDVITKMPVTYLALEKLLTAWKQPKPDPGDVKPVSVARQITTLKSWETAILQNAGTYKKADLQKLADELQELLLLVQHKMKPPV